VVDVWDPAVVFAAGTFVVFCTYHVLDHLLLLISERYQVRSSSNMFGGLSCCYLWRLMITRGDGLLRQLATETSASMFSATSSSAS
jgi:hypothetical protein